MFLDPLHIVQRIRETLSWFERRESKSDLRSPELHPQLQEHDEVMWLNVTPEMVHDVVERRRVLLEEQGVREVPSIETGRLLVSVPFETNHNGLTMSISNGFFDNQDVPPWDVWVGGVLGDRPSGWKDDVDGLPFLLLTWIPPDDVAIVTQSIDAECIGMLAWLDEVGSKGSDFRYAELVPQWLRDVQLRTA